MNNMEDQSLKNGIFTLLMYLLLINMILLYWASSTHGNTPDNGILSREAIFGLASLGSFVLCIVVGILLKEEQ